MPAMPKRTATATLRRDVNSQYIGLARHVQTELLSAREVMSWACQEIDAIKSREKLWIGHAIFSGLVFTVLALHFFGLL
jgi:hypothetical protein